VRSAESKTFAALATGILATGAINLVAGIRLHHQPTVEVVTKQRTPAARASALALL
jgi:hypothetical protein